MSALNQNPLLLTGPHFGEHVTNYNVSRTSTNEVSSYPVSKIGTNLNTPLIDSFELSGSKNKISARRFSKKNAMVNFFKGVLSPVTEPLKFMAESARNLFFGMSLLGGSALVLRRFGSKLSPFIAIAGSVFGIYQGIKGITAFKNSPTPEEKEKAFTNFGISATSIGLSWLGIRNLKRFLPFGRTSLDKKQHLSKIGNSINGAHAAVEPLEKMGQVSSISNFSERQNVKHFDKI